MSISELLGNVSRVILNPLIIFGFVVAVLYFFWGILSFILASGKGDETGQSQGKKAILWGLIGMFIMVSVFGIIRVILNTFGLQQDQPDYVKTLINDQSSN